MNEPIKEVLFPKPVLVQVAALVEICHQNKIKLACAESCTGGLLAGAITAIPGVSGVFDAGFITYSNAAKEAILGVPPAFLNAYGAVSEPVARAMAEGALKITKATLAIACTGIAGPGGGTLQKPVGRVHIAVSSLKITRHKKMDYGDIGREAIRLATIIDAIALTADCIADIS